MDITFFAHALAFFASLLLVNFLGWRRDTLARGVRGSRRFDRCDELVPFHASRVDVKSDCVLLELNNRLGHDSVSSVRARLGLVRPVSKEAGAASAACGARGAGRGMRLGFVFQTPDSPST